MHKELTAHLNWHVPLERLDGRSRLLQSVEVYVDFVWENHVKHPQRTFQNHKSLAEYIRRVCPPNRKAALILTIHNARAEGCEKSHATHDIFIINIVKYKSVANADSAGAYFAGLEGSRVISTGSLNEGQVAAVLDSLSSFEALIGWISSHPEASSAISASLGSASLNAAPTDQLLNELSTRLPSLESGDLDALSRILQSANLPDTILQAAVSTRRQAAVEEFQIQLSANTWNEKQWQGFFKREEWIFGHGLLYHFVEFLGDETYVGGKNMDNTSGKFADFTVRTTGEHASFINIVEIKIPSTRLLGKEYRTGVFAIHEEFSGAMSQIIGMCNTWNREGSIMPSNQRKAMCEKWETAQPRGILVVGHTKEIGDDFDKRHAFELFRRHLHGVEILTFDELLSRAENMLALDNSTNSADMSGKVNLAS